MSIKKLFESSNKIQEFVSDTTAKSSFNEDAESLENVEQRLIDKERYTPQIDFSRPELFAKYGSARLYYKSALTRISDYYPYDGSEAEINKFLNGCLQIERYIFDNQYPRTNGYIELGRGGYSVSSIVDGYGKPTTNEFIDFFGGPGTGSSTSTKLKELMPSPYNNKKNYSNIYDESIYQTARLPSDYGSGTRTSNLKSNFDEGVTVEFWLKTGSLNPATLTNKQVIFDLWNQDTSSDNSRMIIELTSSHSALGDGQRPFLVTVQSGSYTTKDFLALGSAAQHSSSGDWNHYAITLHNTGSNFRAQLYVNGQLNDTATRMPYDLATAKHGILAVGPSQERSWPHAIENDYSSADSLQGWWRLNNSSSVIDRIDDMSGRGKTGTFDTDVDKPTIDTTNFPSAYIQRTTGSLNFDGAAASSDAEADKVNIGLGSTWDAIIGNAAGSTRKISLAAWFRAESLSTSFPRIIDFGSQDVAIFLGEVAGDNVLYFHARWTGTDIQYRTTNAITLNQWNHVVVTYDASGVDGAGNSTAEARARIPAIYINGVEVAVTRLIGPPTDNFSGISGQCYIGNRADGLRTFDGQLADVAVWNSILTANEVRSIYSAYTIKTTTHTISEFGPKNLKGRIGALQHNPPGATGDVVNAGRLVGFMDEFRFWKTKRTSAQIGKNWFGQVRGGTNSDISNTTLGVYYKFNEGITTDNNVDAIVLDYAGRVTNGVWTGYTAGARNPGSAIVSASASSKEFKDPIIRTNHPRFLAVEKSLLTSGSAYDYTNNSALINLVPSWILQQDDETQNTDLKYITHIMGAYFDNMYHQISDLPKLRHQTFTSGSFKPISFAEHLPQSLGLYSPELFIDSTILEKIFNRSKSKTFENDLYEAKNLIYQNLYNNLSEIYKAKGTEQAIKNVLKCFNINDNILALRINSNNTEFTLKNNLEQQLLRKPSANFSIAENNNAVIYQRSASFESLLPTDTLGSITGSIKQYGHGFSYEANIIFPNYEKTQFKNNRFGDQFNEVSLFGTVTVDGTDTDSVKGIDLTSLMPHADAGNFKFSFVRDEMQSKNGFFKLTYFDPTTLKSVELQSPVFNDVYDNTAWNLSVRVKPENYPLDTFVEASGGVQQHRYEVIFAGYNALTTDLFNSFKKSSFVTTTAGKKFIESAKRVYVGAERTDVVGTIIHPSDVLVSSVAYWTKYLQDTDLQQHSLDLENVGLSGSIQPISPLDNLQNVNNKFVETLGHDTLALNWNFRNVTGSDAAGNFVVQDFSSGSQTDREAFGWTGEISGYQYLGYGFGFPASSTNVVKKQPVNIYKFVDPERPVSSDMIQIFNDTDDLTPNLRREEIVPNYVYSLEKSLYNAISEEMLDFLAGIIDFNDVVGHPVHYYRDRYKDLEKLRQQFFRRVTEVSTVERYTEYYKWFDDAITTIISQLVPASSEYVNDIQNVVESHVLERNKYQNRLGILDSDKFDLERAIPDGVSIAGAESIFTDYIDESSTTPSSPRRTNTHLGFWRKRADRSSPEITSGDPTIDAHRNKYRDIIYSNPHISSAADPITLFTIAGEKYNPSTYFRTSKIQTYRFNVAAEDSQFGVPLNKQQLYTRTIKGGVNFESAKNFDFAYSITKPGGPVNGEGGKFVPLNVMLGFTSGSVEIPVFQNPSDPPELIHKKKKIFKVQTGRDWELGLGYKNVKSSMAFPFNVYSSSVELNSGYNAAVVSNVGNNLMITNVHNDVYGEHQEVPMQGPFTHNVVGGHQSRHVPLNTGNDQQNNRPEAFRILLGTCDMVPTGAIGVVGADYPPPNLDLGCLPTGARPYPYAHHGKAYLYRDHATKRPVNIKNIKNNKNNKTIPGNYDKNYEILYSFGASNNPRAFVDNQPTLPAQVAQTNGTTNVRTFLDIHRGERNHFQFVDEYNTQYLDNTNNKSIIVSQFSAPGGIEVMTRGYKDFRASEFSVYSCINNRNLTVIKPQQAPSGTLSETTGNSPSTIRTIDIHGNDFGLTAHAARHSARFGRDSVFVSSPGASYVELPSFYKIHRNRKQVIVSTNADNTTFATSSKFDNYNIIHPIPRSDRQYLWLSRSVEDVGNIKYANFQKTRNVLDRPFRTSSAGLEFFWTFVSASSATTGGFVQPTNNLNIIINEPIDFSTNTMGHDSSLNVSNYTNVDLVGETPNKHYLNQLLSARGTNYGWGWNKLRQYKNRILINDKKNNQITIATGSTIELSTHTLRPLSFKGRASYANFNVLTPMGKEIKNENVTLKFTNTNEKIYFNDVKLDNLFDINLNRIDEPYLDMANMVKQNSNIMSMNWFLYRQNVVPSIRNEFGPFTSKRVGYDNKFWRDSRDARAVLGNTLSSSMIGAIVSKSSWPLDAPKNFLTRTGISGTTGSAAIKFDSGAYLTRQPFVPFSSSATQGVITGTSSLGFNFFVPAGGELQNTYFSYFTINTDGGRHLLMQAGPLYARKHVLGSPKSVVSPSGIRIPETGSLTNIFTGSSHQLQPFAGEALWEAADQAGIVLKNPLQNKNKTILNTSQNSVFIASASNPWYNDYDSFKKELKITSRGYSIVPEYRMSEHVKDYFNFGINNKSKTNFFEIVGTDSSSANTNFYKDYSNSDFLQNILGIETNTLLKAKEIKLTCDAVIKYNPYKGFYPAQRTVDLAEQFADSFKDSVGGAFSSSTGPFPLNNKTNGINNILYERAAGVLKPLLDPLVSPGILYNSIKSGIAVDYPIVSNHRKRLRRAYGTNLTASTQNYALSITGSATEEMYVSGTGQYLGGQYWDKRIPFEAIIEPRKYILNTNFIDMESHPSMSLDWNWNNHNEGPDLVYEKEAFTGSFSDNADGVYSMMARNFFGACGEFFLESSGITRLESNTVLNDLQFDKDTNFGGSRPLYMARVKLRRSHNGARTYDKEFDSYGNAGASSYYGVNGARRTINGTQSAGQYALPQDPMHNSLFKETFTMYSRPTAFGPPCAGRPTGSNAAVMPFLSASKDSFSGFNPAFTPPYYDGEAWADLIFRPHVLNRDVNAQATAEIYDLNRILNETQVVCWRFDPGEEKQADPSATHAPQPVLIPIEQTQLSSFTGVTPDNDKTIPSIYDGKRINVNSMQLTSSVKLFGTEKVLEQETDKFGNVIKNINKPVGSKWIIQPKWETPMLNFNDEGVHPIKSSEGTLTLPTYGSASVPRGMWHQFGVIPENPNKGIFLEITDIPEDWLKNHYSVLSNESSPYNQGSTGGDSAATLKKRNKERANLYKHIRSLSSLCGFDQTNSSTKLGQIKDSFAVHEAVVAVPYILEQIEQGDLTRTNLNSFNRQERKKFISIPKRRFAAARKQLQGSAQGDSLAAAGESIRKLKQLMEKFVFPPEFDFLNNKEVDPIAMYVFEFKYEFDRDDLSYIWQNIAPRNHKKFSNQKSSVTHNLANNEIINREILMNDQVRWMVFKVKQRCQTDYYDLIADQANESTRQIVQQKTDIDEYKFGYNWPYDYLSFVELIKLDIDILLKKDE